MERQPKVSVIMPVYNTEKYLRECLDSVVNQTLRDIEIICVDDGSTDDSLEILHEYEAQDERVKVLTQQNQYAGAARNHGMSIAAGEYMIFWDADDFFESDAIEQMYKRAVKDKADICLCGSDRFDAKTGEYSAMPWMLNLQEIKREPFCAYDLEDIFGLTSPAPWTKLFRTAFLRENDLQFQGIQRINDLYLVFSALALAERIVSVNKVFVHYRMGQDSNLQSGVYKTPLLCCDALAKIKDRLQNEPCWSRIKWSFANYAIDNLDYNLRLMQGHEDGRRLLLAAINDKYFQELGIAELSADEIKKPTTFNRLYLELQKEKCSRPGMPAVSVVVPVHDDQDYIEKCLDSLTSQTLNDIEIICVDDASKDRSPEILRAYAQADSRIRLIEKEKNQGALEARKDGALHARGRYIMFVDSDDYLEPDACMYMYKAIREKQVDILLITSGVEDYAHDDAAKTWLEAYLKAGKIMLKNGEIQEHFFVTRDVSTSVWGKLYDAPKCKLACYNTPNLYASSGEDIFQQFFFALYAESLCGIPTKPLYWYRRGLGGSNSAEISAQEFEKYCRTAELYTTLSHFSLTKRGEGANKECIHALGARLCEDCTDKWYRQVSEKEKSDALRLFIKNWSSFPDYELIFERRTGQKMTDMLERHLEVPQYVRIGKHYGEPACERPKVSIIITVYNGEEFLRECVESVLRQTLEEIEIVCVNDGSYDDSLKILEEYADKDDRFTIISQYNKGLSEARNVGLLYARGEYLAFLDDDDMLAPEAAAELFAYASREGCDLLFFGADSVFQDVELRKKFRDYAGYYDSKKLYEKTDGQALFAALSAEHAFRTSPCMQLIRADFLKKTGLNFYPGIYHEDNLFTVKGMMLAESAAKLDKNYYIRRIRSGSIMTSQKTIKHLYGYFKCYTQLMVFVELHPPAPEAEDAVRAFISELKRKVLELSDQLNQSEEQISASLTPMERLWFDQMISNGDASADEAELIRSSVSYKAGRLITFIPRKLRGGVRCVKENGWRYTANRLLVHLRIKKEND